MIAFELHGVPQGKGRPRSRIAKGKGGQQFIAVYTPSETRAYERAIALAAKVAMRGKEPLAGALKLTVTAFLPVPTSWSQKKRDAALAGSVRPIGRGDWDNFGKAASDAINGIVWNDDVQVVDGRVIKLYDERPRLRVEVNPIEVFNDADC